MKLIVILVALVLEHFFGSVERLRNLRWVQAYADGLHGAFGRMGIWGGVFGVLVTAGLPLVLLVAVLVQPEGLALPAMLAVHLLVLLYSLGPRDLNLQIDAYLGAVGRGDEAAADAVVRDLTGADTHTPAEARTQAVMEAVLVAANERLFAVYFWYAVAGPVGALLFRLLAELRQVSTARTLEFTRAAVLLHALLNWIPSRLFALGFALAGSLTHTFDAWQFRYTLDIEENDNLIRLAGMGAMQFDHGGRVLPPAEERDWIEQVRSLVGRTFCVWLTVLALLTLAGWSA